MSSERLDDVLTLVELPGHGRVLDMACGKGEVLSCRAARLAIQGWGWMFHQTFWFKLNTRRRAG